MRSYENSGYNPYNENSRSQSRGSARNYYSDENDLTNRLQRAHGSNDRGSSGMGSGRDSYSTSGYGGTSTYGRSAGSSNSGYGSSDSNRYGSSNYGSSDSNRYGSSNTRYGNDNDYSNRYGSDNDSWSRAGNKAENMWERTKDNVSDAWNNMTNDNDNDRNSYNRDNYRSSSQNRNYGSSSGNTYGTYGSGLGTGSSYGTSNNYNSGSNYGSGSGSGSSYGSSNNYGSGSGSGSNYGSSNYGSGSSNYGSGYGSGSNYGSSNYGSGYGSSNSSYGRSSDRDRYSSNDWNNDRDNQDRGFFERAGDEVRSWFGDDEAERRRRMDEMRDRNNDNDYNRYGSSRNTQAGPPYSYGSSSRRDYEW